MANHWVFVDKEVNFGKDDVIANCHSEDRWSFLLVGMREIGECWAEDEHADGSGKVVAGNGGGC